MPLSRPHLRQNSREFVESLIGITQAVSFPIKRPPARSRFVEDVRELPNSGQRDKQQRPPPRQRLTDFLQVKHRLKFVCRVQWAARHVAAELPGVSLAHLVTDKVVVALHRVGLTLLVVMVISVVAAINFTAGVDGLVNAVILAGIAFGLPALGVYTLAYWFDGHAARLEGHPGERRPIPRDSPSRHPFRAPLSGYIIAVAATAGAWAFRAVINPYLPGSVPFITFFAAIAFSGWIGGYGPAVLSVALSATIARYFYMVPVKTFLLTDAAIAVRLGTFVFVGLIIGGLTAALRAALQRVQELADRLVAIEADKLQVPSATAPEQQGGG
ncbi:MAG: DUF4118 domain-containing protein [Betaproteobacteria bacterium]